MVGVGGLAGWVAVAPLTMRAAPFFGFLALWEIAGRNLPNDLADVVADSRVDIRTVATVFGNRVSAWATLATALATMAVLALLPVAALGRGLSIGAGAAVMVLPAIILVGTPRSDVAGAYFNRASLLPALAFAAVLVSTIAGL
jgi:4-hydroxybenzoate polyprenyltransferase